MKSIISNTGNSDDYFASSKKMSIKGFFARTSGSKYDDVSKYLYGNPQARVEAIPETWGNDNVVMSNEGTIYLKDSAGNYKLFDLFDTSFTDALADVLPNRTTGDGSSYAGRRMLIMDSATMPHMVNVYGNYYKIDADALLFDGEADNDIVTPISDGVNFGLFDLTGKTLGNVHALFSYKPMISIKSPQAITASFNLVSATDKNIGAAAWDDISTDSSGNDWVKSGKSTANIYSGNDYIALTITSGSPCFLEVL